MATFELYVPPFAELRGLGSFSYATMEELLSHPRIAGVAEDEDFHRFSQTDGGKTLMAELSAGYVWWIVGFSSDPLFLPEWHIPPDHPDFKASPARRGRGRARA
jgi:hypothetical protein